ncbi:hypothetical protein P5673_025318 [Acropora cervicornis]|uniref:Uncharacterized protein n=1 Tax=Acropora cervicornis TaxID=6130 RepID=A0AAD9Q281_ACRCE|nr:hypothetical protein P5673_025318 [Acropora cervicornis]
MAAMILLENELFIVVMNLSVTCPILLLHLLECCSFSMLQGHPYHPDNKTIMTKEPQAQIFVQRKVEGLGHSIETCFPITLRPSPSSPIIFEQLEGGWVQPQGKCSSKTDRSYMHVRGELFKKLLHIIGGIYCQHLGVFGQDKTSQRALSALEKELNKGFSSEGSVVPSNEIQAASKGEHQFNFGNTKPSKSVIDSLIPESTSLNSGAIMVSWLGSSPKASHSSESLSISSQVFVARTGSPGRTTLSALR